jgi:hypothetical protein
LILIFKYSIKYLIFAKWSIIENIALFFTEYLCISIFFENKVSHTTDDLVFEWEEEMPLDVSKNIELPQLQLEGNYTNDCTQVYATGILGQIYVC